MGSAFTPVRPRRGSPMHGFDNKTGVAGTRGGKRMRQATPSPHQPTMGLGEALRQPVMGLEKVDEEEQTIETVPDNASASASEASTRGSADSAPPLLEYIGVTCVSAWFTSCFPCAVVDINDNDDYVVDRLSRESAMSAMYAQGRPAARAMDVDGPIQKKGSDQEKSLLYVQLPELQSMNTEPLHSMPSVIQEGSDEEVDDETMDEVSLNDDAASMPVPAMLHNDSSIAEEQETPIPIDMAIHSASTPKSPLKKKFSVKRIFGRKKKG